MHLYMWLFISFWFKMCSVEGPHESERDFEALSWALSSDVLLSYISITHASLPLLCHSVPTLAQ